MNQEGSHNCWRVRRLFATALVVVASLTGATPAVAQDNVVLQWNDALLQTVRTVPFLITARALAILHTSMYDAWAAYDPIAVGTRFGSDLRRPVDEHTDANKAQAISFAAYRALVDLFPTQKTVVFDPLMERLGYDPSDTTTDMPSSAESDCPGPQLAHAPQPGSTISAPISWKVRIYPRASQ